jgi:hypothetical protein
MKHTRTPVWKLSGSVTNIRKPGLFGSNREALEAVWKYIITKGNLSGSRLEAWKQTEGNLSESSLER